MRGIESQGHARGRGGDNFADPVRLQGASEEGVKDVQTIPILLQLMISTPK